jgi:GNAT superfamily N-acetyltransferase
MEFDVLGGESAGPTLRLDHEEFAYAGKFVMSRTGKTVVREDGDLLGAVAFSADTDDERTVHLRYVTVREDRRGEGIGPRLLRFTADSLQERYDRVVIAVNNPMAYEACYRAGFANTGEETGIAELLLEYRPDERDTAEQNSASLASAGATQDGDAYSAGFAVFRERDLPPEHAGVCDRHESTEPPAVVEVPGRE